MARIPALGDGGVKSVVNGPITYTPDANPLIGPAYGDLRMVQLAQRLEALGFGFQPPPGMD